MTITNNYSTVLSKAFGLVFLSLIPTALSAFIVASIPDLFFALTSLWSLIGILILAIGSIYAITVVENEKTALILMFAFSVLMGITLSPIALYAITYSATTLIVATVLTFSATGGITLYAIKTKKDFSAWGGLLSTLLILFIVISLLSIFVSIPFLNIVLSAFGVLLFSAYLLFDVSRVVNGGEDNYIIAAVSIYLDILNLFINIFNLLKEFDL